MKRMISAAAAVIALAGVASAQVTLAEWTFETSVPAGPGPHAAEGGLYGGNAFAVTGGTISNPVGNGSGESMSSNGWNQGNYFEFVTSSVGYENLTFEWDQVRSSTGPEFFDLVVSTDGMTFSPLLSNYSVRNNSGPNWSFGGPRVLDDIFSVPVPGAYDNQPLLVFRLVSLQTTASTGTNRVDNVILEGFEIPAPGAVALFGLGGLVAARRRRA